MVVDGKLPEKLSVTLTFERMTFKMSPSFPDLVIIIIIIKGISSRRKS